MQTQEVIEGWRGVCVSCGLGTPTSRALTAALATGAVMYTLKMPRKAFRPDGTPRSSTLSGAPDATATHFLLTPVAVGAAVFLFT